MSARDRRQNHILSLVRRHGFVSIEALAQQLEVTPQTIRRDINELCEDARLQRYHGGAGLPSSVENLSYSTRQVLCLEEKKRIAREVARHIPDHASLFINIGTTTEEVAKALMDHAGLRIITNNLNVAGIMSGKSEFEVIVAGGVVRPRDRGIVGEATIDLIRQFKVDIGIIGISGIDNEGELLDFDYREVRVAQTIIEHSRQVFLAADHSKFGRSAMVRLGNLSQIDVLFTDRPPPAAMRDMLGAAGVSVQVAEPEAAAAE
ncbi:MAG: DeoR family transcriptional regulator [Rhodospirillales bacterium]|nr:DeoR family transcriptional regulator [Rhodospirillales bacterium]MDH3920023.1 DeoR family transcriptional regulator [Rhodospirillales bacterium]